MAAPPDGWQALEAEGSSGRCTRCVQQRMTPLAAVSGELRAQAVRPGGAVTGLPANLSRESPPVLTSIVTERVGDTLSSLPPRREQPSHRGGTSLPRSRGQ